MNLNEELVGGPIPAPSVAIQASKYEIARNIPAAQCAWDDAI